MSNVKVPAIDENYDSVTTVRVVAIDANYDSVTTPPFEYRQAHVYPLFKNGKFRLQQFSGIQAIREAVRSEADTPIEFLTGSGHGRSSVFSGFETFTIYGLRIDRMDEPKGRIVHFLACETAEELGPDFIKHGCRAFFGYEGDFSFPGTNDEEFFECDSTIDILLAQGLATGQVLEQVLALFDEKIADLRARHKLHKAALLEEDRDRLTLLGDKSATLF